ncbi:MAG: hypothetical protein WCO92_06315, partial [Verrucomicrobiota bacterium]
PLGLGGIKDEVTVDAAIIEMTHTKNISRDQWLYVNFRPATNRKVRQKIYDEFQRKASCEPWITFEPPQVHGSNENYLTQLLSHRFVLAPPGNGVDTHRLWESLIAGAYPIALRSSALEPFEALPILFVNDYSEVTYDFLKANLKQLAEKKKNNAMLYMSYWDQKIKEVQLSFSDRKILGWNEWLKESIEYGLKMIQRRIYEYSSKK